MSATWLLPGLLGDLDPTEANDSCCWGCGAGGDVLCCDGCRVVYHAECLGLPEVPEDEEWFCPLCVCAKCGAPCKAAHPCPALATTLLPVQTKALQPREYPQQRLPTGPGYVCPQQLRLWLTDKLDKPAGSEAPPAAAADGAAAPAAAPAGQDDAGQPDQPAAGCGDEQQQQQDSEEPGSRRKRRKTEPVPSSSGSASPLPQKGANGRSAAAAYVRCCCCQKPCHISCLGAELRQQYMQPPQRVPKPAAAAAKAAGAAGAAAAGAAGGTRAKDAKQGKKGAAAAKKGGAAAPSPAAKASLAAKGRATPMRTTRARQQQDAAGAQEAAGKAAGKGKTKGQPAQQHGGRKRSRGKQQKEQEQEQEAQPPAEGQEMEVVWQPLPPYFCSPACQHTATQLAKRCAQGAVQLEALADGTPVCWQLVQPAAVAAALAAADAAPQPAHAASSGEPAADGSHAASDEAAAALAAAFAPPAWPAAVAPAALLGTGNAPGYSHAQAVVLLQVLRDAQELMSTQLGPAWEVRAFDDALPWLLSGLRQPMRGGVLLDLSHFHAALLWVGSTLSAAALLRVLGGSEGGVLEVSLVASARQLQDLRLGGLLMAAVERFALQHCKVKQAWMPALGGVVRPCVGLSLLPVWEKAHGARERLQPAPGSSTAVLGLRGISPAEAAARAGGPRRPGWPPKHLIAELAAQRVPKGVDACWAGKLGYGKAASLAEWLALTKYPLLRYSYVPFVSKRLDAATLLEMPQFARPVPARPPPLPPQQPLLPQLQLTAAQLLQQQASLAAAGGGGDGGGDGVQAPAVAAPAPGQQLEAAQQQQEQQEQPAEQQHVEGEQQRQLEQPALPPAAAADGPQQQQPGQPQAVSPPSKRQQWKEQVMREFLARQQVPMPAPADPVVAVDAPVVAVQPPGAPAVAAAVDAPAVAPPPPAVNDAGAALGSSDADAGGADAGGADAAPGSGDGAAAGSSDAAASGADAGGADAAPGSGDGAAADADADAAADDAAMSS